MMNLFKNVCTSVFIGMALVFISNKLDSNFLAEFIESNLIMLLIALLAINTTTLSVIMTKLKDLSEKHGVDFASTVSEMKLSINEQIVMILLAVIFQIIQESSLLLNVDVWFSFAINSLLTAIFVFSIDVLYDTAKGIFVILNFEKKG